MRLSITSALDHLVDRTIGLPAICAKDAACQGILEASFDFRNHGRWIDDSCCGNELKLSRFFTGYNGRCRLIVSKPMHLAKARVDDNDHPPPMSLNLLPMTYVLIPTESVN